MSSSEALLFVPTHPTRELDRLLKKAGISKKTKDGTATFHSLRATFVTMFVTMVGEQGATVKDMQSLVRHSDLRLTMNVYAKSRDEREAQVIEGVFKALDSGEKNANSMRAEKPQSIKRIEGPSNPTGIE